MRISWIHPALAERVRHVLRSGRDSWEDLFDARSEGDAPRLEAEPPEGVSAGAWPALAEHVARAERVREVAARFGEEEAVRRFAGSPHAVERAVLLEVAASTVPTAETIAGLLDCAIDEHLAYGHILSRLVELGASADPDATVSVFERFVAAATKLRAGDPSWPERVRVAQDGLAALYVRVGRADDADALYARRFAEEPTDTTIAIGAGRAFLEAGDVGRAVVWLERAAGRASDLGRADLGVRLRGKVAALRGRMS